MYNFGKRSRERLNTCHPDIIKIMEEVIKIYDFSVLEGLRSTEKQKEYYNTGRSKLDGVTKLSKHQDHGDGLSYAIDICGYVRGTNPFDNTEDARKRFYFLAGIVFSVTEKLYEEEKITHKIRWGGDWQMDMIYKTESEFVDLPHFELINPK